jgi:exosortase/archaeosortase family protein
MDEQTKRVVGIFIRYIFVFVLALGNFYVFYMILTPLTVLSVSQTIALFQDVVVFGDTIYTSSGTIIQIVEACVAGSAFFLMFLLVFSTANMEFSKRIYALAFSLMLLFLSNYLRIIFLIAITDSLYFDFIHWFLWHFVSIILVVGIWFFVIYLFKIESIPIYSDVKYLISLTRKRKKGAKDLRQKKVKKKIKARTKR